LQAEKAKLHITKWSDRKQQQLSWCFSS